MKPVRILAGHFNRYRVLVVLLLSIAAAAGCGGEGDNGGGASPTPTAKADVLRLAYSSTVTTWDPSASYSVELVYLANCYEPLIYANPPGSAEPFSSALATSWEVSSDALEWTFKLREGVTFHDGTPFNAQAVKYSIERTKKLNLGAAYIWGPVKKVKVVDDYTVKFVLSTPTSLDRIAASSSGSWIFSPATADKGTDWWDQGHEAGTGPWMLKSYKPNEELVFVRNPDWWGGWHDNQFRKVVVKVVGEASTQRQLLEGGEVDYVNYVARDQVDAMEANPNIDIVRIPSWTNYFMSFNTQHKPLDDIKVRRALSYAVPYADILTVAAGGNLGTQARGPVPVGLWPNGAGDLPQYTYDIEKARQLLAEAGHPDGGFKLTLTYSSENPLSARIAPLIKEAFAKLGVEVTVQPLLWNQVRAKADGPAEKRQDLIVWLWWPTYPDGFDNLSAMFLTEKTPAYNLSYWYNEHYDKILLEANRLAGTDIAKAQQLYTEAQAMLIDEAADAYLFDTLTVSAKLKTITLESGAGNPNYPLVLFWTRVTR